MNDGGASDGRRVLSAACEALRLQLRALVEGAPKVAPHVKYADGDHNGYLLVELGRDSAAASWWFTGNRTQRNADAEKSKTLICETGTHQLS